MLMIRQMLFAFIYDDASMTQATYFAKAAPLPRSRQLVYAAAATIGRNIFHAAGFGLGCSPLFLMLEFSAIYAHIDAAISLRPRQRVSTLDIFADIYESRFTGHRHI